VTSPPFNYNLKSRKSTKPEDLMGAVLKLTHNFEVGPDGLCQVHLVDHLHPEARKRQTHTHTHNPRHNPRKKTQRTNMKKKKRLCET
jgi:hypothetical protein